MCKAPKVPKPKEPKKPQFLRNKYLDEFVGDSAAVKSLKSGRNSLRIPMGEGTTGGRQPGESLVPSTPAGGGSAAQPIAPRINRPPRDGDFRGQRR